MHGESRDKEEFSEEKKHDDDSAPFLLMAKERFNSLKAAVSGTVGIVVNAKAVWMIYIITENFTYVVITIELNA